MFARTTNPLHFEDLEPHRFEDLVRQLSYDFRNWNSIEALGRSGSDDGIDIRGIELIDSLFDEPDAEEETEPIDKKPSRVWIIQCKREKTITPAKIVKIVAESFPKSGHGVYGFILAAACDFSKKTREAFGDELNKLGIQEYYIWGKAELEDKLFMPKNDHLLFAYFGFSLQVNRKSVRTTLRSRLAIKRKLSAVFGKPGENVFVPVLLRYAQDDSYPEIEDPLEFEKDQRWRFLTCVGQSYPDYLTFIAMEFHGYLDDERRGWDAFTGNIYNMANNFGKQIYGMPECARVPEEVFDTWTAIPEKNRAILYRYGYIHFDRILAVDEDGDVFHSGPHIFVDMNGNKELFDLKGMGMSIGTGYSEQTFDVSCESRIEYFDRNVFKDIVK